MGTPILGLMRSEFPAYVWSLLCGMNFGEKRLSFARKAQRTHHSCLSLSAGSPSGDSINLAWKIFEKKIPESSKKPNLNLLSAGNNVLSVCIVFTTVSLGIIINLENETKQTYVDAFWVMRPLVCPLLAGD